ncbi:hypothetical protein [Sphingomonas sp.]|uniref:hypothetical protein n=1 Tax=Sphingomonas sp. TaxID=28214 RepID=UPI001ECA4325|nr:hypothetical protein [Sphingomonas sp.]MBX3593580.1 hypothetical protein [Sphingomonas sp.]
MDADKRAELVARRAALQASLASGGERASDIANRPEYAAMLDALDRAGVAYFFGDLNAVGDWIPHWVPSGWGEMPWHLSISPHIVETGTDPCARATAARAILTELADPDAPVAILYENDWVGLRLSTAALAAAHLNSLLTGVPRWGEVWIVALPGDWLIRIDGDWVVSCVPGEDASAEFARMRAVNRDLRRAAAPLRRLLVAAGVRVRLLYPHDMTSLSFRGAAPVRIDWHRTRADLSVPMPGDRSARDTLVRDFLAARLPPGGRLRLAPWPGGLAIELARADFDSHAGAILDRCHDPVFFSEGEDWVLELRPRWVYGKA